MVIRKPITTLQLEDITKRYDFLVNLFTETILSLPLEYRAQIVNKIITSPEERKILLPVIKDIIITAKSHLIEN